MAHKGIIPWNKGLTKETSESLRIAGEKNRVHLTGRISPKRKYSMNPDDWILICENCGCDIIYKSRDTFKQVCLDKKKGRIVKCRGCCQIGTIRSEETRKKQSESAKNRTINDENEKIRRNKIKKAQKNRYANMSSEDREELNIKINGGRDKKSDEEKKLWSQRTSNAMKKRMLDLDYDGTFKPGYNKNTIEYIDTILSEQYGCEFIHAESEKGEFKIYDKKCKKFYFADAYSPELNLWIEIDEKYHYRNGELSQFDVDRENRIKEIQKCNLIRIKYNKIGEQKCHI